MGCLVGSIFLVILVIIALEVGVVPALWVLLAVLVLAAMIIAVEIRG